MFEYFLTHILKRTISVPLGFGLLYPTLGGNIVFRSIKLNPPESVAKSVSVDIPYMRLNPKWLSIRSDVLKADSILMKDVKLRIDVSKPAALIHCLRNKTCSPAKLKTNSLKARTIATETAQTSQATTESTKDLRPLKVATKELIVEGGRITLFRGKESIDLRIVRINGEDLALPLRDSKFSLAADVLLETTNGLAPVRAKIVFDPKKEEILVAAVMRDVPLSSLNRIFPKLLSTVSPETIGSPENIGDGLGESKVAGVLSGELRLRYSGKNAWQLN